MSDNKTNKTNKTKKSHKKLTDKELENQIKKGERKKTSKLRSTDLITEEDDDLDDDASLGSLAEVAADDNHSLFDGESLNSSASSGSDSEDSFFFQQKGRAEYR